MEIRPTLLFFPPDVGEDHDWNHISYATRAMNFNFGGSERTRGGVADGITDRAEMDVDLH